jgi:hypothetical protein
MFNTQYNNQDLQQLNGLMGELQQNYSIQSVPKQKKVKSFNSVTDKLREEAKKQQLANDKLNSYTNSRDMYEHGNVHQQYVNPHANSSLTGINSYKKSLNQDNMFPKDLRENINNKMDSRLFENVTDNKLPLISDIQDEHNMILNHKPHLEERSKNLYKQQTNDRLNSYSPLSRSAYLPTINPDNVNDRQTQMKKLSPRDVMNQRLTQFKPLSCNISLKKPNNDNKNIRTKPNYEKKILEQTAKYQQAMNEINHIDQGGCNNVATNNLPVSTTN